MSLQGVSVAAATDVGRVRDHNEDRVTVREDLNLFLVADGAGGHKAGDVAAKLALESIVNYFRATEADARNLGPVDRFGLPRIGRRLSAAVQKANRDVVEISKQSQRFKGMGTTIVAARLSDDGQLLHVAHVGDSRCYRLRAGYLDQLTEDHSLLNDVLEERPEIDDAVIERLPKNVVTRALGMNETVRVTVRSHVVAPGDRYLLCTDGLTGPVGNSQILTTLEGGETPEQIVRELIALANGAGGPDNVAALVLCCDFPPVSASERMAPPSMPAPNPRASSDPEILLLGIEEVSLRVGPEVTEIAVVPSGPRSDDLASVLRDLVRPALDPKE